MVNESVVRWATIVTDTIEKTVAAGARICEQFYASLGAALTVKDITRLRSVRNIIAGDI